MRTTRCLSRAGGTTAASGIPALRLPPLCISKQNPAEIGALPKSCSAVGGGAGAWRGVTACAWSPRDLQRDRHGEAALPHPHACAPGRSEKCELSAGRSHLHSPVCPQEPGERAPDARAEGAPETGQERGRSLLGTDTWSPGGDKAMSQQLRRAIPIPEAEAISRGSPEGHWPRAPVWALLSPSCLLV